MWAKHSYSVLTQFSNSSQFFRLFVQPLVFISKAINMSRSLFILDPNNEESIFCIASAGAILNIFIEEKQKSTASESFPVIEAMFFLLHRMGNERLLEIGKSLAEELKMPKGIENHIRQEIRRLLGNASIIPSREKILASWNLPFGTDM
jgi:hypothetical protein